MTYLTLLVLKDFGEKNDTLPKKKNVFLISLEEQGQKLISIVKIIKNNTEWECKM